jgi:hypothetical protein
MSLIDEALRRARQQAASQDAARRDEQYRQVPVLPPMASRRDRSARPTLIAAAVAVCVVAGIGIGVLLGRGSGDDRTTAVVEMTPAPVVPPPESSPPVETPSPSVVVEETPEPAPVPTSAPAPAPTPISTPTPTPERQPEDSPRQPRQELPASEAEPVSPPPALDATPTPVVPVPEPTPEPEPAAPEVRTYVREVPLPDGGTIRLNGIAYSAATPVALINDRVLGKGESYQGFIIADIQAGMVELHGKGMIVRVSLK